MSTSASTWAVVSRRTLMRAIVVAVVLAAGVASIQALQAALNLHFVKKPMELRQPLSLLSKELGSPTRYTAQGFDGVMNEETLERLGTKDYLLRTYYDKNKKDNDPTAYLSLNLNYYPIGDANPHVPEFCWAGQGMNEAACSRRLFDIPEVRRADGSVVTLQARMISFLPPGKSPGESEDTTKLRNVAYIFNVNGEYVAIPQEVTSRFWKASNEYAYDTKIELTVGLNGNAQRPPDYCSQDQAIEAVRDFFRSSLASIEECLPASPKAASAVAADADSQHSNASK